MAAADVHLTVAFPATAGGDGDGSATYMPTEHAGRRSSMAGVASMAGVGRARTTRRLADAAQQQLGEGEACFSVLTQGPPKLGAASIAGAAGLLPEPPASGSAGQSRPLSPRAATDQLRVQQELEARTQQLNSLFEQQLKAQYESMKREASKLGRLGLGLGLG